MCKTISGEFLPLPKPHTFYVVWREEQTTDTVGVASGLGEAFIEQK